VREGLMAALVGLGLALSSAARADVAPGPAPPPVPSAIPMKLPNAAGETRAFHDDAIARPTRLGLIAAAFLLLASAAATRNGAPRKSRTG
jgi:hypothetical protein